MPGQTLAQIASSLPCVIYQSRPGDRGEFLFITDAIERLLGYSADEWRADPGLWLQCLHPDDRGRVIEVEVERVERLEHGQYAGDTYRMLHRDGHVVWVQDEAVIRKTTDGVFWEGVLLDVTATRDAEDALREREASLARAETERRTAEQIAIDVQRALLPVELPQIPGLELSAEYRPGADGTHVGGDFYDVIALDDGRVAFVIGDVTGQGPTAAAVMGQIRQAIRAYTADGHPPSGVLERVDRLLREHVDRPATVFLAVLDLETSVMRYASAGHLPPILIGPDAVPVTLESEAGVPLGSIDPTPCFESVVAIEPGSLLLLFTDGLVESPQVPIVDGYRQLARVAAPDPTDPAPRAQACADRVSRELGAVNTADDAALLVIGVLGEIGDEIELAVPADRSRLATLRRSVSRWLRESGASPSEDYELTLACAELCANAVDHAYGPAGGDYRVRLSRSAGTITIDVVDDGAWRAPRGEHRGRGLELVQSLADDVTIHPSDQGTTVTLTRTLEAAR